MRTTVGDLLLVASDLTPPRSIACISAAKRAVGELEIREDPGRFDFMVIKPGQIIEIKTDLEKRRATLQCIQVSRWGALSMFHTFTGVRMNNPEMKRDWLMTSLFSMDAVALGFLLMVFSANERVHWLPR